MAFELDKREAERRRARPGTSSPPGGVRALASALGNQRFAALAQARRSLAREELAYPGPDRLSDPERCAVDVCAVDTAGGAKHLFILYTNEKDVQYGYRAGPDKGAFNSVIATHYGLYGPDTFADYDLNALTIRALDGSAAQGKGDLLSNALLEVEAAKIPYQFWGPNSNTVVSHLLAICDIPRVTPVSSPVGWDAQLFGPTAEEREAARGGAEGSSPDGPEGGVGAGGAGGFY